MLSRIGVFVSTLVISLHGFSASVSDSVGVCYGESLGAQWNVKFEALISEIFTRADVKFVITPAPTRRSLSMINQDQCKIFTVVSQGVESKLPGYYRVRESLFDIELNLYTYPINLLFFRIDRMIFLKTYLNSMINH